MQIRVITRVQVLRRYSRLGWLYAPYTQPAVDQTAGLHRLAPTVEPIPEFPSKILWSPKLISVGFGGDFANWRKLQPYEHAPFIEGFLIPASFQELQKVGFGGDHSPWIKRQPYGHAPFVEGLVIPASIQELQKVGFGGDHSNWIKRQPYEHAPFVEGNLIPASVQELQLGGYGGDHANWKKVIPIQPEEVVIYNRQKVDPYYLGQTVQPAADNIPWIKRQPYEHAPFVEGNVIRSSIQELQKVGYGGDNANWVKKIITPIEEVVIYERQKAKPFYLGVNAPTVVHMRRTLTSTGTRTGSRNVHGHG